MDLTTSRSLQKAIDSTLHEALMRCHEYVTPEHFLYTLPLASPHFTETLLDGFGHDASAVQTPIEEDYFTRLDKLPSDSKGKPMEMPEESAQFAEIFSRAAYLAITADSPVVTIPHVIWAITQLGDTSFARNLLYELTDGDPTELIAQLSEAYGSGRIEEEDEDEGGDDTDDEKDNDEGEEEEEIITEDEFRKLLESFADSVAAPEVSSTKDSKTCVCLTDRMRKEPEDFASLIGRKAELQRMMQVLCRCEKGNPLLVGDPGVGKTALVNGLAKALVEGDNLPLPLQGAEIFVMNLAGIMAKSEYRGQVEKNLQALIKDVSRFDHPIVLIEDIHLLVGAGRGDGALDAASVLRPHFESGKVRFIGTTTHGDYNRSLASAASVVRCFQRIDLDEPSQDETVRIIEGIRERYERHHGVELPTPIIEYAVQTATRYINDRCLPDKAIDLIDETGGWMRMHPEEGAIPAEDSTDGNGYAQRMTENAVRQVVAQICHVDALADSADERERLLHLEPSILARIYGQDEAVRQVVEAVQMSRAGLMEDGKPVASFLFVGPTGVGKTEVARVLAQELGVELIRFDMSEYAERHTVAKLIGSPAGYVGYDDGGLLTDAVRKNPHCVLLFDEIEKAHADVYNIFLQMMDYARVTDNKGRKTDFRHAVIIFTSNAGAQYASQAAVGFAGGISKGESMLRTVKKTFKPEFISRLSATVVFHDMDRQMASLILDKKLGELRSRLATKGVTLTLTPEARDLLLRKGFSATTGAREMDHIIAGLLKPLFTRAILFGSLKDGGEATVRVGENEELTL